MPHAALVAAAEMNAERHAGKACDQRLVGLDRAREILLRILAARAHLVQRRLVDIGGVARRVDVDVAAAGVGKALDDLALDRDHVGHEGVHVLVDRLGILVREALADAVRPDQRHFGRRLCDAVNVLVFLERHVARELEPRLHRTAVRDRRALLVQRDFPAPQRGGVLDALRVDLHGAGGGVVALHRRAETVLEIQPAHLAVTDDVETDAFLEPDRIADRVVLDAAQLGGVDLALLQQRPRLLHGRRPQQAADHIGADGSQVAHGSSLRAVLSH